MTWFSVRFPHICGSVPAVRFHSPVPWPLGSFRFVSIRVDFYNVFTSRIHVCHCLFSLHLILNLASPRFARKLSHNSESMPRVFAVELSQLSAQAFSDHQPVALCEIVRWALCSCRFWPCAPSRSGLSVPGQKSTGNVEIGDIWNHHRLLYTIHTVYI